MAPPGRSSKRQKLSPTEDTTPETPQSPQVSQTPAKQTQQQSTTPQVSNDQSNRTSWYNRTWPKKTTPVTEVARESISSASTAAIDAAIAIKDQAQAATSRKSSLALTQVRTASHKSLPASTATTKDHATIESSTKRRKSSVRKASTVNETNPTNPEVREQPEAETKANSSRKDEIQDEPIIEANETSAEPNLAPKSWIGWLAGGTISANTSTAKLVDNEGTTVEAEGDKEPRAANEAPKRQDGDKVHHQALDPGMRPETNGQRGWLSLWNSSMAPASVSAPNLSSEQHSSKNTATKALPIPVKDLRTSETPSNASSVETSLPLPQPQDSNKSSAWVFWSRGHQQSNSNTAASPPHEGEIAISHTPSQNHPKRASIDLEAKDRPQIDDIKREAKKEVQKSTDPKQEEPSSLKEHKKQDSTSSRKTNRLAGQSAVAKAVEPTEIKDPRPASPAPSRKIYEQLLLPSFQETLKLPETPSLIQQLSRLFSYAKDSEPKHLYLQKDPPKLKNALAIGVHGYFPAPVIRTVLGQPTGTSIKFADMAASAIKRWTKKHGYECQVKTAALEGEGKIAERIELLWKLLLNWIDEIRKADFVLVSCHSQGVPVAIMLVSKLIHFGCLNASRVGICAMAGVNQGPFPEYRSRWISGSAGELFEFSDPQSKVSNDYLAALEETLKAGVRITYIGSIDDQLVSLESAIYSSLSHPNIFRAVSIDSKVQAPNFLSHLVAFALKLRNMGVQDHGLIRELSAPLAGSLYTGEGHSRIYEDDAAYDLAVSFALETTTQAGIAISKRTVTPNASNPYILPFAMRGILEEDFVRTELQNEVSDLLTQFDEWRPATKALKDVKFRLEGIRSKL